MSDNNNTSKFFIMTQREIAIQKLERTLEVLKEFRPNEPFDNEEKMSLEGSAYLIVEMDLSRMLQKLYNDNKKE